MELFKCVRGEDIWCVNKARFDGQGNKCARSKFLSFKLSALSKLNFSSFDQENESFYYNEMIG